MIVGVAAMTQDVVDWAEALLCVFEHLREEVQILALNSSNELGAVLVVVLGRDHVRVCVEGQVDGLGVKVDVVLGVGEGRAPTRAQAPVVDRHRGVGHVRVLVEDRVRFDLLAHEAVRVQLAVRALVEDPPRHLIQEPMHLLEPARAALPARSHSLVPLVAVPHAHGDGRGPVDRSSVEALVVVLERVRVAAAVPVSGRLRVTAPIRHRVLDAVRPHGHDRVLAHDGGPGTHID